MKKTLTKIKNEVYYYEGDKKIMGAHSDITGDISSITGSVSGIRGDISSIRGDVSGLRGDVDDCEITEEDRKKGIDIKDLIK